MDRFKYFLDYIWNFKYMKKIDSARLSKQKLESFIHLCILFRKDVGSDFKTDSFCVTNFCFLHLFTDLYTQVRKTTFTFSAICAYSGDRVGRLAKATIRIKFLRWSRIWFRNSSIFKIEDSRLLFRFFFLHV